MFEEDYYDSIVSSIEKKNIEKICKNCRYIRQYPGLTLSKCVFHFSWISASNTCQQFESKPHE
jgi:hypothetical protein